MSPLRIWRRILLLFLIYPFIIDMCFIYCREMEEEKITHALVREKYPHFQTEEKKVIDIQLIMQYKGKIEEKKLYYAKHKIEDSYYSTVVMVAKIGCEYNFSQINLFQLDYSALFYPICIYFSAKEEVIREAKDKRCRLPVLSKTDSGLRAMIAELQKRDNLKKSSTSSMSYEKQDHLASETEMDNIRANSLHQLSEDEIVS